MKLTDAQKAKAKERAHAATAARQKAEHMTIDWDHFITRIKIILNDLDRKHHP